MKIRDRSNVVSAMDPNRVLVNEFATRCPDCEASEPCVRDGPGVLYVSDGAMLLFVECDQLTAHQAPQRLHLESHGVRVPRDVFLLLQGAQRPGHGLASTPHHVRELLVRLLGDDRDLALPLALA